MARAGLRLELVVGQDLPLPGRRHGLDLGPRGGRWGRAVSQNEPPGLPPVVTHPARATASDAARTTDLIGTTFPVAG